MMQAMSSGASAATRSAMSSGSAAPAPAPSSQACTATWPRLAGRLDRDDRAARSAPAPPPGAREPPMRGGRDDHRPRAAIAEDVAVVVDRVGDVGRHGDRAGAHDREIGDDPFRPVLGDERRPGRRGSTPSATRPRASRLTWSRRLGPAYAAGTCRRAWPTGTAASPRCRAASSKNIAGRLRQLA